DFHLIIGRNPKSSAMYMTMEISGLPPKKSKSFKNIQRARDAFKGFFGAKLPGPSYHFYRPPIPVEIEGSLFFDITHAKGGHPGPQDLRPHIPTIWEVHPVTKIVFEPGGCGDGEARGAEATTACSAQRQGRCQAGEPRDAASELDRVGGHAHV